MANTFIDLPAHAANGSGAAVDVSTFGADKTIVVHGLVSAFVLIEYSNDPAHLVWAPALPQFNRAGFQNVQIACRYMRATVLNYDGAGAPTVAVGALASSATFAELVPPAGNGDGASVDVSALPAYKTVQVSGEFRGAMNIEASTDGGVSFATIATFSPGSQQTWSGFVTADHMRIMRSGVTGPAGAPVCYIGASSSGGGGGGGGGDAQVFRYVATGAELATFPVALPVARASANYNVQITSGGPTANDFKDARALVATFAVDTFDVEMTVAPDAGDILMITVEDLT